MKKNLVEPKKNGSMRRSVSQTVSERRQCREALKKSMKRKPAHPQDG